MCPICGARGARRRGYGGRLIQHAAAECRRLGFSNMYLTTEHIGYYEQYGFLYLGDGFDLTGEKSRIYKLELKQE